MFIRNRLFKNVVYLYIVLWCLNDNVLNWMQKRKTHKPVFKIKSFFGPWFYCSVSFEASSFQWLFREVSDALTSQNGHWKSIAITPAGKIPDSYFAPVFFFLNVGWLKLSGQEKSSFHPDEEKDVISNWKGLGAGEWEKYLLFISVSSWVSDLHLGAGAECCSGSSGKLTWGPTVRRGSQIPTASSGLRLGRGPHCHPALLHVPRLHSSFPRWPREKDPRLLGSLVPPVH